MEVEHGSDRARSMGNANLWTWMIKLSGTINKPGIVPIFRDIRYGKMSKNLYNKAFLRKKEVFSTSDLVHGGA